MGFYAFRFELIASKDRILAVLIPSYSFTNAAGELVIARSSDGHFYLDAVGHNKQKITFLVDTGASNISLSIEDAKKLGISTTNLKYTQRFNTANGTIYAAPVRISQLTIGGKVFYDLSAHINPGSLDAPLLGMSLIEKFKDFKITKDMLILSY